MGIGGVSQPLTSFEQTQQSVKNNPGAWVGLFSKRNPGGFEGFLHFLTTRHPHLHRDLGDTRLHGPEGLTLSCSGRAVTPNGVLAVGRGEVRTAHPIVQSLW